MNLFSGLVANKMPEKVLDLLDQTNIQPDQFTLTTLFSACAQLSNDRAKQIGRKLLHQIPKHFETNNYTQNSAINMLMKFGDVQDAEQLFQTNKKIDVVTYGAMMKGKLAMRISQKFDKIYLGYVENKMSDKALDLFEQMPFTLHDVGYTIVFNACAQLSNDRAKQIGRKLLDQMPKQFETNNFIRSSAISMLMKFGDVQSSEKLFQMNKKKDLITYGAMMKGKLAMRISQKFDKIYLGYVENNMSDKALDLFEQIPFNLNDISYTIIFNACAQLLNDRAKQIGRKLLDQMPKQFKTNNYIQNSAISMLMKFGDVQSSEKLFQMNKKKDLITYGAMMNGYNVNNEPLKCLQLLEDIKQHGFILDEILSTVLINACARLSMLSKCQSIIDEIPSDLYNNQRIRNSLIHMWVCIHCSDSCNNGFYPLILFCRREKLVLLKMLRRSLNQLIILILSHIVL